MSEFESFVRDFLVESYENLEQFERDLVALEENPADHERLARAFRAVHTIKGSCAYLDFQILGQIAHAGEELLSRLRCGEAPLNAEVVTALLALADAVRKILATIECSGKEGADRFEPLTARLTSLYAVAAKPREDVRPTAVEQALPASEVASPEAADPAAAAALDAAPSLVDGNLRVDVGLLDRLMNLVGELVLARNQLLQLTASHNDRGLINAAQRLDRVTTQLQEGVMKTRMQPIGNLWNKLPRVVRDLGLACGKQVRLTIDGSDTELDKTILEAIKDPLTHLVRNAVDHGIEPPHERQRLGKPAEGQVKLRAAHEGGQVHIEISDDGRGMDVDRIKQKAVALGLVQREHADRLGEHEILQLIFLPGLSTAEQVSAVSGRGVGMDVVKAHVERVGGSVDLESRPGLGTTLTIKIPLTLAIIPALIVTCRGDRYAIPQAHVLELVRLEGEQVRRRIESFHGVPVYRLRGELLPLVHLDRELRLSDAAAPPREVYNIVVVQAGRRSFGLVVDGVNDTEEIVVKPLSKLLKALRVFAGATVMGDGQVTLILDVMGVAPKSGAAEDARNQHLVGQPGDAPPSPEELCKVLIFNAGNGRRLALPLERVLRLEEIPRGSVECSQGREAVQYRREILPLVRLNELSPGNAATPSAETLQVIVVPHRGRSVGLVVERVIDVVETPLAMQPDGHTPRLTGAAVIQQRVTDVLDVDALLDQLVPAGVACGR